MTDESGLRESGKVIPHSAALGGPVRPAPPGAADCHIHFFDSRVPPAPGASITHADATPAQYKEFQRVIGTSRCVVVQPSGYGFNNRPTLEGMAALGTGARAVAVVPPSVTEAELERLNAAGVRGIRFNLVQTGVLKLEDASTLAPRLAELGWHIQFHMVGPELGRALELISQLPCRLVFDHMGRVGTADSPEADGLCRLLDTGRAWIKLSAPYLEAKKPAPYSDRDEIARRFARAAPTRMVWGSDWPHVTEADKPDDAALFDLLAGWAPDESTQRLILVDNPQELYGFV